MLNKVKAGNPMTVYFDDVRYDGNAEDFSRKWHLLMEGAIVSAMSGDRASAQRAKDVAALLLASERPGESR